MGTKDGWRWGGGIGKGLEEEGGEGELDIGGQAFITGVYFPLLSVLMPAWKEQVQEGWRVVQADRMWSRGERAVGKFFFCLQLCRVGSFWYCHGTLCDVTLAVLIDDRWSQRQW